jgi:hypothetical protein
MREKKEFRTASLLTHRSCRSSVIERNRSGARSRAPPCMSTPCRRLHKAGDDYTIAPT